MQVIPGRDPFFEAPHVQLFQGDSLELMEHIAPNSVDMIFADPPYGLSNGGFTCQGGKRAPVNKGAWDQSQGLEEDFAFHRRWIQACRRILKPSGTIWISGSYHSIFACGYALQLAGFKVLNDIAWFKPNGAPNLSCRYFTASHETLIWALKDPNTRHVFHYEEMKHGEWHANDLLKKPNRQMRSVWSLSTARGDETRHGKHPTQKPVLLLERIVKACTNPGDLIVDPFAGSSTTGLAALRHERRFVGIDVNPEYLALSRHRLEGHMARRAELERRQRRANATNATNTANDTVETTDTTRPLRPKHHPPCPTKAAAALATSRHDDGLQLTD